VGEAAKGCYVLETRTAGTAVLVTSNNRRPRAFRNPVKALEVIRELGLQNGRFSLEAWRPDEVGVERPGRPDRAEAMKATHAGAAAYDKWVREQAQEAIDDPRPTITHDDVMKKAETRIEALRKGRRAKGRMEGPGRPVHSLCAPSFEALWDEQSNFI